MKDVIGIIQVRGIGDAIIALPIAAYYHYKGYRVLFALDDRFCESFQAAAPYCKFIPVPFDSFKPDFGIINEYWYELPKKLLMEEGCKEENIISFPYHESHMLLNNQIHYSIKPQILQRLSGPYESFIYDLEMYKHLKFDEFKYATAKVPFNHKWLLDIRRNKEREQKLFDELVDKNCTKPLLVTHLEGSNIKLTPDMFNLDTEKYNLINIDSTKTNNIFDWLLIIERADAIIALDSVFCNLIEQLNFRNNKYFIRRSNINMTPVLINDWKYVRIKGIC